MAATFTLDQKARALGVTIVSIWESWGKVSNGANETDRDNALHLACEAIAALDLTRVGMMSSSLGYFALAVLEDCNPEDLTYCEMIDSIGIALAL